MIHWLLSSIWYLGALMAAVGIVCFVRPMAGLRIRTRRKAAGVAVAGIAGAAATLFVGTSVKHAAGSGALLDQVMPEFQIVETHHIEIAAAPEVVYRAVRDVTPDEIALYRTLTRIRCLGTCSGDNILNPQKGAPILETALRSGFRLIAESPGIELVLVTFTAAPPGAAAREWTRDSYVALSEPGFAKAAMNFRLEPQGPARTTLHTETRVFCTDPGTVRVFTAYWRTIAPGSDLIRRAWLRAIKRRAER